MKNNNPYNSREYDELAKRVDALLSGEATAKTMGIRVEGLRFASLLLSIAPI